MKYVGAVILVMIMFVNLGCGSGNTDANPLVGTWALADKSGNNYVFKSDSTGSLKYDDTEMEFTWSSDGELITMIFKDQAGREGIVNYSVSGDVMELWHEGIPEKSIFNRQ